MIYGCGDISKVLGDREGAIIFAAGVSNSQCTDENEFLREKKIVASLLRNQLKSFFYFSSISIFFKNSRYTQHKIEMEDIIRSNFISYNIIRLGNISWGDNPNTFMNYIKNKRDKGEEVEIRSEFKYIIGPSSLNRIVQSLPLIGRLEISIFGDVMSVEDALKVHNKLP